MDTLKETDRKHWELYQKLTKPGDLKDERIRLKQHLRSHQFAALGLRLFYTLDRRGPRHRACEVFGGGYVTIWDLAKKVSL